MSYAGLNTLPTNRAESLLIGRYINATNLKKYINIFAEQFDEVHAANQQVLTQRSLGVAVNKELEGIGEIVGQPRGADKDIANSFFGFEGSIGSGTFESITPTTTAEVFKSLSDIEYIYTEQDDTTYKNLIKAKIIKNSESITIDALIRILLLVIPSLTSVAVVEEPAQVRITFPIALTDREKLTLKEGKYIPKPAGVNYIMSDANGIF